MTCKQGMAVEGSYSLCQLREGGQVAGMVYRIAITLEKRSFEKKFGMVGTIKRRGKLTITTFSMQLVSERWKQQALICHDN